MYIIQNDNLLIYGGEHSRTALAQSQCQEAALVLRRWLVGLVNVNLEHREVKSFNGISYRPSVVTLLAARLRPASAFLCVSFKVSKCPRVSHNAADERFQSCEFSHSPGLSPCLLAHTC